MLKSLEQTAEPLDLAQLRPLPGERLRVESRVPRSRFVSELIGYKVDGSVLISAPRAGALAASVSVGSVVTVRLMAGNRICAFSSRLLRVQPQPFAYWHLEYPGSVEVRLIRSHTRVPVRLKVALDTQDDGPGVQSGLPCAALCSDISLQGACVETLHPVGVPGDRLFVTLRIQLAGIDQVLLMPALIRNQQSLASGFRFGLEFLELEEDSRVMLAGFVYQQMLLETGYIEAVL
ncbi:flagellar brake domain-containing protein [Marinobacterium rhizophilum]|uniref:Flagellar brake domain-containing protein n=1 Tax=Marinobacterium rhizophilum TaxID=420402 RepID=A0ABY5HMZ7_9GAMM|nr:PilZ domain-containing protein [Marinobacterium rhizophilum]UTW13798.1 flagellar brake domain-containing protein [Marinobacterium rhizophilum]